MKNQIPNAITLLNLFSGCCAIVAVFNLNYNLAILLFILSLLADFVDGLAARLLNASSPIGKELDSLADMVSFGFFPGVLLYDLLEQHSITSISPLLALPAFLITIFSAIRLARFNVDIRQSQSFIGLPTPAAASFTLGFFLLIQFDQFNLGFFFNQAIIIYSFIGLVCYLLIAEIPMFSLKFKGSTWSGNEIRIIFIALSLAFLILLKTAALFPIILLYLGISLVIHVNQQYRKG